MQRLARHRRVNSIAGRRVRKIVGGVVTKYLYDGDDSTSLIACQIIAEYNGSNVLLRRYFYGPGIDEPICMVDHTDGGKIYYYHYDGLGSVIALSNSTGDIVEWYSYDVFGEPNRVSSVGNPYMFTGREYDTETGLYYYRARYYEPEIGRFMQTDPVGYAAGLNLYTYCRNNPANWVDPWGLLSSLHSPQALPAYIGAMEDLGYVGQAGLRCQGAALDMAAKAKMGGTSLTKLQRVAKIATLAITAISNLLPKNNVPQPTPQPDSNNKDNGSDGKGGDGDGKSSDSGDDGKDGGSGQEGGGKKGSS